MTQEQIATYKTALKQARATYDKNQKRLAEISAESSVLQDEAVRLRRTITALAALCSESPGFDNLGITDTVMEVMENYRGSMTTSDVLTALENMGFDLSSQKHAGASVHAVLGRLAARGKIAKAADKEGKIVWQGPKYDPKFDEDIPF